MIWKNWLILFFLAVVRIVIAGGTPDRPNHPLNFTKITASDITYEESNSIAKHGWLKDSHDPILNLRIHLTEIIYEYKKNIVATKTDYSFKYSFLIDRDVLNSKSKAGFWELPPSYRSVGSTTIDVKSGKSVTKFSDTEFRDFFYHIESDFNHNLDLDDFKILFNYLVRNGIPYSSGTITDEFQKPDITDPGKAVRLTYVLSMALNPPEYTYYNTKKVAGSVFLFIALVFAGYYRSNLFIFALFIFSYISNKSSARRQSRTQYREDEERDLGSRVSHQKVSTIGDTHEASSLLHSTID